MEFKSLIQILVYIQIKPTKKVYIQIFIQSWSVPQSLSLKYLCPLLMNSPSKFHTQHYVFATQGSSKNPSDCCCCTWLISALSCSPRLCKYILHSNSLQASNMPIKIRSLPEFESQLTQKVEWKVHVNPLMCISVVINSGLCNGSKKVIYSSVGRVYSFPPPSQVLGPSIIMNT